MGARFAAAGFVVILGSSPAFAIPSPELVVGSLSSLSQLFALVSAMLGGGAALAGVRSMSDGNRTRSAQLAWRIVFGCAVVLVASLSFNFYQYSTERSARQTRLEATLTRPTPVVAGKTLDPALKEASYRDQQVSPRGMSTEQAEKLLKEMQNNQRPDMLLLDIRETAEAEMGSLPGSKAIRFPDLAKSNIDFTGKTVFAFCHNGNRSYETCERLAAMGIDCRFIVGGLEKWLVEQRTLTGLKARTLDDLRALPPFRNQATLLDTDEVHQLVKDEGAVFVDVRYPGEFAAGQLPKAINLPIRPTPSDELRARIQALPQKPIIVPCYDRRSCFFGEVIGLELERAGRDFRGRYTLPWEYFVPSAPRPYIEQWLNESRRTWWSRAVDGVAIGLEKASAYIGILAAILLLALLSRLLVAPLSIKAERDQMRARELSAEVDAIKQRLAGDGPRLAREMRAFYKRNGFTPMRNLLALLFLPLMAVSVSAVHAAAVSLDREMFWLGSIADRDPTFLLPLLFAALICAYLDVVFVRTRTQRLLTWLIGMPALVATGALLSAAADIYMIASAALLLVQRAWVSGSIAAFVRRIGSWRDDGIVSLQQSDRLTGCGNKAYRLSVMLADGIPVPDGVVLTGRFLETFATATPNWRGQKLDRLYARLGSRPLAVRSSANAEDGGEHSFAGIFDSVLGVDRDHLEQAILDVHASFGSERAKSYGVSGGGSNILVQQMVEAEYAGVMFSRDPGSPSLSLIEMVQGTADRLVSGEAAPESFRYARLTGRLMSPKEPPMDLAPLIAAAGRADALFGKPQDVEWTYKDGRFFLVQSRDITRLMDSAPGQARGEINREWSRVLDLASGAEAVEMVFAKNELSEMLPRPTPLSLSLMSSLWQSGGSVDLACRSLGLRYRVEEAQPDLLVTVFGSLYIDKRQEKRRSPGLGALAARRLTKREAKIEAHFRDEFLPTFQKEMALLEAVNFDRLADADLQALIARVREDFVHGTNVEVNVINIAADVYVRQAKEKLVALGLDPAHYLTPEHQTALTHAVARAKAAPANQRHAVLVEELGHRAPYDYELAQPRYSEASGSIDALMSLPIASHRHREDVEQELSRHTDDKALRRLVGVARRYESLKEDAKHHSLRQLAVLRHAVLALDRRFALEGLAFYLDFAELHALSPESRNSLVQLAGERRMRLDIFGDLVPLESSLTIARLEDAAAGVATVASTQDMAGTRVSGSGMVEGRACVCFGRDAKDDTIPGFQQGDIVVSSMVPPGWVPYFRQAGGFVAEVGGWLSHTAIVARECDVSLIVGATGIRSIETGMRLRLHADGAIEIIDPQVSAVAAE
jgi:rhodanese-related sulfurtransferase/membrane protein insertase Oxa1/YidC/SpoIIIJ/phosphohistidine swiveling domain-containing protein